jgi:hypothetical protein
MLILFIIGFICLLLVIGAFVTENAVEFAIKGVVATGAIAFVATILFFAYILIK